MVYVRASNQPDKLGEYKTYFQERAAQMDARVVASAKKTGGVRHIRFAHDAQCTPTIATAVIDREPASNYGIQNTINELMTKHGFTNNNRKYFIFVDSSYSEQLWCGLGGNLRRSGEDASNAWNKNPAVNNSEQNFGFALVARHCWGNVKAIGDIANADVGLHELFHTFGAVSPQAPHRTTAGHCSDDQDIMCYKDADGTVLKSNICPTLSHNNLLDCNNDDYFHTAPPAGSYLSQYWNSADSRWLAKE
jgi:hypothetical protein